ncbi:tenascin [Xiphophorus hellerii]|uniref:tenascin n=1 Tax=Xiphophorus hellerii TaxID=8084 RepID=UPI0013B3DC61|nr:tenascin-like [Xiphophorus hellerii]
MLITLGLLLLLTPFPSFQTTTLDKRDPVGSNVTKANTVLTFSKPKTTAAPSKQSLNPTLKPNTVTVTILPTAGSNQKSATNAATTTKSKLSVAVVQTTPPSPAKAPKVTDTNTNRDKHKVNQTASAKLLSLSEEKANKIKPEPTGVHQDQSTITKLFSDSHLKTSRNKLQQSHNQTTSSKSSLSSNEKNAEDKSNHNVPSILPSGSKPTKDRAAAGNQTVFDIPLTTGDEKSKDKLTPNVPSLPASGGKTSRGKTTASGNQTIAHHPKSDEKSKDKSAQSFPSLSTTSKTTKVKSTVSTNQTTFDNSPPSGDKKSKDTSASNTLPLPTNGTKATKNKHKESGHQSVVGIHLQINDEKAKDKPGERAGGFNKDKEMGTTTITQTPLIQAIGKDSVGPSQPLKVVISFNGDWSHTKEQELTLKPGAPLVMTHSINLLPGGCTGGCEAEMAALKGRLTRLEREMSLLKEKCPCSANCPNDCSGKGKCEKGKCICHKGFTSLDCSKCAKDAKCFKDNKKDSNTTTESMNDNEKEARGEKPEIKKLPPTTNPQITKEERPEKLPPQDDPRSNVTLSNENKTNSTKSKNESKNKSVELSNTNKNQEKKSTGINRISTSAPTKDNNKVLENNTTIDHSSKKLGGLGSVKAVNISTSSFTITWLAPQRMFKNFTVVRREPRTDSDTDENEGLGEEIVERDWMSGTRTSTEVHGQSTNTTISSGKSVESRSKTETKRISRVVPGSARSFKFSNLKANTRYVVHVFGSTADRRSKIHRVTATTGPEKPTELVFSNVTESSLTVSWTKPNTIFTGFRVTYINIATGKSQFVSVDSHQSSVVLSALSAGSSYIISVTTTKGSAQSDELTSVITTVPAPPTHLQVINVTDNTAMLRWTPSLGKVDRFIVSYGSSKTPNVTVTVMLLGNSVQYQLKGLQRGTLYKVKVRTQKNNLQSMGISTSFTTANVVKASEIGGRSAVIAWRTSVVFNSYRVIYQMAKEEAKEVILESPITEYKLTGLIPSSFYSVVVQGEKNGKYTSLVTSQFITGKLRFPFPTECSQELLNGALESGEVTIYPQGKEGRAVRVYCDMETDGGGWTVFQRRMNGKTDFYRTWSDYKAGFGNLSEEFWLGNDFLHNLTSIGPVSLRVDLQSGNDTAYARYTNFSVASEGRNYTLTVSGYTGTAGDSMKYHNGRPFSTRDKEPDPLGIHCAKAYVGGWWYKNCYKVNLNGLYGMNSNNQGIVWIDWKGKDSSIPFSEMKFRPSRFSPATHG